VASYVGDDRRTSAATTGDDVARAAKNLSSLLARRGAFIRAATRA
jgi:hypothetical protein